MVNVDVSSGTCGHEERGELAGSDEDESPQNEGSVSVADDPQMPPDSEVFPENRLDVGIDMEHLSKVLEPEDLQAAD